MGTWGRDTGMWGRDTSHRPHMKKGIGDPLAQLGTRLNTPKLGTREVQRGQERAGGGEGMHRGDTGVTGGVLGAGQGGSPWAHPTAVPQERQNIIRYWLENLRAKQGEVLHNIHFLEGQPISEYGTARHGHPPPQPPPHIPAVPHLTPRRSLG